MTTAKYSSWVRATAFAALLIGAGLFIRSRFSTPPVASNGISYYVAERDRDDIIKLFYDEAYWMSSNERYSPEFMLDTKSPNEWHKQYFGKLIIEVLHEKGELIGYVVYYMENFYRGRLLFLAVDKKYRGKRYGEKLLRHGIQRLFDMGASIVTLVTRTNNISGQKLYGRVGFKETGRADGFIDYVYKKDQK